MFWLLYYAYGSLPSQPFAHLLWMGCCIQWLAYVIMPVSHVVKQTQIRIYQKQKRVQSPVQSCQSLQSL